MPLAHTLRPTKRADWIGQTQLIQDGSLLRLMFESGNFSSMIFWGPPSSGKTTMAEIIATETKADFVRISAVMDGKSELRKLVDLAEKNELFDQKTILFIDEIHRWNKAQQDALLPYVESGQIILIGATTENPSFEIISALLSRSHVIVFEPHQAEDVFVGLHRGLHFLKKGVKTQPDSNELVKLSDGEKQALETLATIANGDMRFALNSLEVIYLDGVEITEEMVKTKLKALNRYDKNGEEHYNIISAVHKSLRSSNASAASYWICRMLDGGEDPVYIARRLLRFASEDIGNASPTALLLANGVFDTCQKIGMPECGVALIQLAEYLARAPKNNSAYVAFKAAMQDAQQFGNTPVPLHLRNAPTSLMKDLDYGKSYEYDHNLESKKSSQQLFPDSIGDKDYFDNSK